MNKFHSGSEKIGVCPRLSLKITGDMQMHLAKNLKRKCEKKGISLSRLARESGVPVSTLHAWTVGRTSVNLSQLRAVSEVLEVSLYSLVFLEDDPFERSRELILMDKIFGDLRLTLRKLR